MELKHSRYDLIFVLFFTSKTCVLRWRGKVNGSDDWGEKKERERDTFLGNGQETVAKKYINDCQVGK